MFISNDLFEQRDDDRDSLALEAAHGPHPGAAHQPPPMPSYLELVSEDNDVSGSLEVFDLDPATPPLPYAAE
jgi:hypothetical protein